MSASVLDLVAEMQLTSCSYGNDQNINFLRLDVLAVGSINDEFVTVNCKLLLEQAADMDNVD